MMARTVHLDRAHDSARTRALLDDLGLVGEIACKSLPVWSGAGRLWVVERMHAWMNGYSKLRRCTERNGRVVDFYRFLHRCPPPHSTRSHPLPLTPPPGDETLRVIPIDGRSHRPI